MLNWVDDITYRRRTFTQLTRIEHRHRLAGTIRFGHKGKMYEPYREGQEDELNALGLVLNMVVLWNTRYLNAALNYLRQTGFVVREEDIERLSPLVSHHINFVGKYHFSLPDEVKQCSPFHSSFNSSTIHPFIIQLLVPPLHFCRQSIRFDTNHKLTTVKSNIATTSSHNRAVTGPRIT